jgi:hypothetical protein
MILDHRAHACTASLFTVIDRVTGADLGRTLAIFHADDRAGLLRCYSRDARGRYLVARDLSSAAWHEVRRVVRVVPRPDLPEPLMAVARDLLAADAARHLAVTSAVGVRSG